MLTLCMLCVLQAASVAPPAAPAAAVPAGLRAHQSWRNISFDCSVLPQILNPDFTTPTNVDSIPEVPKRNSSEKFTHPEFEKGNGFMGGPKKEITLKPSNDPLDFFELYLTKEWRFKHFTENTNRKCVDRSYGVEVRVCFGQNPEFLTCAVFLFVHAFFLILRVFSGWAVPFLDCVRRLRDRLPASRAIGTRCAHMHIFCVLCVHVHFFYMFIFLLTWLVYVLCAVCRHPAQATYVALVSAKRRQQCAAGGRLLLWLVSKEGNTLEGVSVRCVCPSLSLLSLSLLLPKSAVNMPHSVTCRNLQYFLFWPTFGLFRPILTTFACIAGFSVADVRDAKNPSITKDKMWRTRPLLDLLSETSAKIWDLSWAVSMDEQTIGFQGRGDGAVRITYKNEGDGFQVFCTPLMHISVFCTCDQNSAHFPSFRPNFLTFCVAGRRCL